MIEFEILKEKISRGMQLAISRLIEKTRLEDGELVFSKEGKITRVKARSLILKSKEL